MGIVYDMIDFVKYRYGMFENVGYWFFGKKGNWCIECGECLFRCLEKLDILNLLKDIYERFKGVFGCWLWE